MIAIHTKLHRAITPKINLAEIFVRYTYQVWSSCVYSIESYRVDKHRHKQTNPQTHTCTNKQVPAKTSNILRYATMMANNLTTCCVLCAAGLQIRIWPTHSGCRQGCQSKMVVWGWDRSPRLHFVPISYLLRAPRLPPGCYSGSIHLPDELILKHISADLPVNVWDITPGWRCHTQTIPLG